MRFILKFSVPTEAGNEAIRDREFPAKLQQWLSDINAEAAYFAPVNGRRGGYIVVNLDDASKMPAFTMPLFLWLNAEVEWIPVMLPEDLAKVDFEGAIKKWG